MSAGSSFTFKPALLRGAVTYVVEADALVLPSGIGAREVRLPWAEVLQASFVDMTVQGGVRMRRLDLVHGAAREKLSVSCTSTGSDLSRGTDAGEHWALMIAIAERLGQAVPGLRIGIGEYGASRVAYFVIGVMAAVFAVGILGLALATRVSQERLSGMALPVLLMAGFGGVLAYRYAPWRERTKVDPEVLVLLLKASAEVAET